MPDFSPCHGLALGLTLYEHFFQDDAHVIIPILGEAHETANTTDRFAGLAAFIFSLLQYPFSSQEIIVDSKLKGIYANQHR
jgi:hypothetical protein